MGLLNRSGGGTTVNMFASADSPDTEQAYIEFRERNSLLYLTIMTLIAIALVLSFHLLDRMLNLDHSGDMIFFRLAISAALLANLVVLRCFQVSRLRTKAHIYAGFYLLAFHMTALSYLSGGVFSPHWVGTMFVLIFWLTLVPFSLRDLALHGIIFIIQYTLILYLLRDGVFPWKQVIQYNFFLSGAYCIGLSVAFFNSRNSLLIYDGQMKLSAERKKSEELLTNMLPAAITERLKDEREVIAESHDDVAILFADIVNFTSISRDLAPEAVVEVLNGIFSRFDYLAREYGLEKIKTIGDAYMVIGGAPQPLEDHTEKIVLMALEMKKTLEEFSRDCGSRMRLRIGIHVGPVVAGVIGTTKYAYDLWGDTVNTASRMESQGIADSIQVTEEVFRRLQNKFRFVKRGTIFVKGRGPMNTYLLGEPGAFSFPIRHAEAGTGKSGII